MKTIIPIAFALLSSFVLLGQSNSNLKENKTIVDTLFRTDKESALEICEKMIPIAISENDTFHITYFLDQAGELNRLAGNFDRSISQLTECLKYKVNWEDLRDLSITYNCLGKTHGQKGQYESAVFNFFEALKLMEKDENLLGQSFYLNNIAAIYDLQHNYPQALNYYQKSLSIKKKLKDDKGIAATYNNMGISYFNLEDYERSTNYHMKALNMYQTMQDTTRIARACNNLTRTFIETNKLEDATIYNEMATRHLDQIFDEKLVLDIRFNAALLQIEQNDLENAENYLVETIEKATEANSYASLKTGYALYSKLSEKKSEFQQANEYLHMSLAYNDSLISEESVYAVADIKGKYEYERQQKEIVQGNLIAAQNKQKIASQRANIYLWVGIAVFCFLGVLILQLMYFNKRRNTSLLQGQLALVSKNEETLKNLNETISQQLDQTKITLEEKEELLNTLYSSGKSTELPPEIMELSKREMEVLSYLALGWTDDQLAEKLFISKSTVKTHLRRIYSKLLVRGRAEAVAVAHKYNIVG